MRNTTLLILLLPITFLGWFQIASYKIAPNREHLGSGIGVPVDVKLSKSAWEKRNNSPEKKPSALNFFDQSVSSFMLINAVVDLDLFEVNNGDVISLSSLPSRKLTLRAQTSPETVGSIKFEMTGTQTRTYIDNAAPYSLFGDDGLGNYYFGTWGPPTPGTYTVKATPYTLSGAKGTAGIPTIITFTFVENVIPQDSTAPLVSGINRFLPTSEQTFGGTLVYQVQFSEGVNGVNASDFSLTLTDSARGTIDTNIVAVDKSTYRVSIQNAGGGGTLVLNLNATGSGITDTSGNALTQSFTSGQAYTISSPPPPVQYTLAIDSSAGGNVTKNPDEPTYPNGSIITLTAIPDSGYQFVQWSGNVSGNVNPITIIMDSNKTVSAIFTMTPVSNTPSIASILLINADADTVLYPLQNTSEIILDSLPTTLLTIRAITSPDSAGSVMFNLTGPSNRIYTDNNAPYSLFGEEIDSNYNYGNWSPPQTGSYSLVVTPYTNPDGGGTAGVPDTINFTIVNGILPPPADTTRPSPISIDRFSPATENTTNVSVIFKATFSEKVIGVDISDFTLRGTASGNIASLSNSDSVFFITVNSISGTGQLGLDLKSVGTGITDSSGNTITSGFTTGQTYTIQTSQTVGFTSITRLTNFTITSNLTADKPQAKVWTYAGKHWAVLANSTGTHLWRLDEKKWTNILRLSPKTSSKADCRLVGNVVHVFLYQGRTSQFVSLEYDSTQGNYELWKKRTSTVGLSLDNGIETATIDIDGTGRMWLANAGTTNVLVRWSDSPYSNWSAPIIIATGITDDDICAVVAMPGKIGVLWSNQNTKRFGFKTHTDGASPATWSNDEVPAEQSALNVGGGMADDHLNLVASSDGTLYCAVKTSYETPGHPEIAFLLRHPNGTWDNMYSVASIGTRPIIVLNEVKGKVRVVYSTSDNGGKIYYNESRTNSISFSSPLLLIDGSSINNPTSTKQPFNPEVVVMASSGSTATSVLASDSDVPPALAFLGISPMDEKESGRNEYRIFPNIITTGQRIQVQSSSNSLKDLMVVDVYGRIVRKSRFTTTTYIETDRLTNGTYFVVLLDGQKKRVNKIIILR